MLTLVRYAMNEYQTPPCYHVDMGMYTTSHTVQSSNIAAISIKVDNSVQEREITMEIHNHIGT